MNPLRESHKVVLVGDHAVGKTSIIQRLIDHKFNSKVESTIVNMVYTYQIIATNGREVPLQIWDTAGQEKFHSITPIYFRDSQAAIIVYDASDPNPIDSIMKWVQSYHSIIQDGFLVIVGNKSDQITDLPEAKALCLDIENQVHSSVSLVSALNGDGIESVFKFVADNICSKAQAVSNPITEENDNNCFC